jgi:hypothetical protein
VSADHERSTPKIFCIGLNKTGTSSLHAALGILGFRSLHWGGPTVVKAVARARDDGRPLLAYVEGEFDAFSDVEPLSKDFALVDEQYPGSRFILTIRTLPDWLDSRRRHVMRNQERKARGEYDGPFLEVDLDGWQTEYREHETRVRAYFSERPDDLLVMDVTKGDGWDVLCPFLGVDPPDEPFPWVNRSDAP